MLLSITLKVLAKEIKQDLQINTKCFITGLDPQNSALIGSKRLNVKRITHISIQKKAHRQLM